MDEIVLLRRTDIVSGGHVLGKDAPIGARRNGDFHVQLAGGRKPARACLHRWRGLGGRVFWDGAEGGRLRQVAFCRRRHRSCDPPLSGWNDLVAREFRSESYRLPSKSLRCGLRQWEIRRRRRKTHGHDPHLSGRGRVDEPLEGHTRCPVRGNLRSRPFRRRG